MDLNGKTLVIATMHLKEQVIQPVLEDALGVECLVVEGLNTDHLGTFTGEKERYSDAITTARYKCEKARELVQADIYVSSEGSFGPHPELLFVPVSEEILFFTMPSAGLEIVVKHLSMNTNFGHVETTEYSEIQRFANSHKFPSHKLILSTMSSDGRIFRKDIGNVDELSQAFHSLQLISPLVRAETDMRAMNNPTRMTEIKVAAEKLVKRIQTCCSVCNSPGFGVTSAIEGLPCGFCGTPTRSINKYKCECCRCGHVLFIDPEHNRSFEDPMYCQVCNP